MDMGIDSWFFRWWFIGRAVGNHIIWEYAVNNRDERRFFGEFRAPKAQMDWDKIRRAKIHCERCESFDWRTGGCSEGRIPDKTCKFSESLIE